MAARRLDGAALAREFRAELKTQVEAFGRSTGKWPRLGVILMGDNPASKVYVRNKRDACVEVGIGTLVASMPIEATWDDLREVIEEDCTDPNIHGVLVQLPLPAHIDKFKVFDAIDPAKDVDVFSPANTGLLMQNRPRLLPCTPQAVREILIRSGIPIAGQRVAIINRSLVVGQPLASMLIQDDEFANATVTVCHEHTKQIKEITRSADIVVTAVGDREKFVLTGDMLKPGAAVIDVAIIRQGRRLIGDADESVWDVAGAVTPVPGGVGPMTVAMLLWNTYRAFLSQCDETQKEDL